MANQSLFNACKSIIRNRETATQNIGGYDVQIEYFNQKSLDNGILSLGDSTQNSVVLLADDEIEISAGQTLTTTSPKKSLVIMCNTFTNNGTVSMTAKGPNVLPHDWNIWNTIDGTLLRTNSESGELEEYSESIIIPAYANNFVGGTSKTVTKQSIYAGLSGQDGANRCCGSGGTGAHVYTYDSSSYTITLEKSGGGSAFAGGGASGTVYASTAGNSVDSTYPMKGSNGLSTGNGSSKYQYAMGGVGYTAGLTGINNSTVSTYSQNSGVGGRVIIFCNEFINNGTISSNGVNAVTTTISGNFTNVQGGAGSGGGAIDIFYTTLTTQGTTTVTGGTGALCRYNGNSVYSGNGGNGSVTFTPWTLTKIVKDQRKKFTQSNWEYLFSQYIQRMVEEQ